MSLSLRRILMNEARGAVAEALWSRMIRYNGVLRSTRRVPARLKSAFAQRVAFQDRTEIQLAVCGHYPGGDYFEFGSSGFNSFRSFLSAFDMNDHPANYPDSRFFAFDVFGNVGPGAPEYFKVYADADLFRRDEEQMRRHSRHLLDRIELVRGFFEDTLAEEFKARLQREQRKVGFAFIDVNIAPSYETVLDFLPEFMLEGRCCIYMDEYFLVPEVPVLFEKFCDRMAELKGMRPFYIRNAGNFGALFGFLDDARAARRTTHHGPP